MAPPKRSTKPSQSADESLPPPRLATSVRAERMQRLYAGISLVVLLVLVVVVVRSVNTRNADDTGPFDPLTTDQTELRRVTEAVSRVIAAPVGAPHTSAIELLESLNVQSAGARDLRDACVGTYRGLIDSQRMLTQVRDLLLYPDGGERPRAELAAGEASRAALLLREADQSRERVSSSRGRCHDLYAIAVRRFGMRSERPASR
ncbi:MAG: hypothetical protein Q8Q09_28690 [Deltaproteobacteria bacterium]|nr:hypothetical protein [Deltaproteobacteria bacterium]